MSELREHTRTRIKLLFEMGMNITEISQKLKVSRPTVRKWVNRAENDISDHPRSGRPTKLTPQTKKKIRQLAENKPGVGTRTVAKKINFSISYQNRGKTISRTTVKDYVRRTEWGHHAYVRPIKPLLTEKNIRDRINFCNRLKNEGFLDETQHGVKLRSNILFTDESPVELYPKPNKQNSRIRTSDPSSIVPIQRPKGGLKIMIAGGISANGKSELHIIDKDKTVNGEYYRDFIIPVFARCLNNKKQFPLKKRAIFMQDGAPAHKAKATLTCLKTSFSNIWEDWPGNSPDLNVIENLWARIQDSVFKLPRPTNRDTLIARVLEEWASIDDETLSNLCHSFKARIYACLENEGRHTKY